MDPMTTAALIGAGSGLMQNTLNQGTSGKSRSHARSMQNDAQDYNLKMFRNRYQNTVKDMKKAGLNPMLAYMQGGGTPSPSPSMQGSPSAPAEGLGTTLQDAMAMKNQSELLNIQKQQGMANILKTMKDIDIKSSEATKSSIFDRYLKKLDNLMNDITTSSAKQRYNAEEFMKELQKKWENRQESASQYNINPM